MLTILGQPNSINVRKVLWTCSEIGLAFEREDWGGAYQSTELPEFRKLNPHAMVPVLKDGDFILWESNTICRYLCAEYQRQDLLPSSPKARAEVEKWMDWQATELNTAWRYPFLALVRNSPLHQDPARIEASVIDWNRQIGLLETHLQTNGPFMIRSGFTLADIVLGLSVNRWLMTPIVRPTFPAVLAYYERLRERPDFQSYGCNGIA